VPTARKFDHLTHIEAIQKRLAVMDITALSMCMEHHLPIVVFDVAAPDAVFHALRGDRIGTIVASSPEANATGGD
jgi:uridylate kinase